MRFGALLPVVLAACASPALAQDLIIDTFETAQGPVTLSSAPGSVNNYTDGSGILQTERNLRVSGSSVAGGSIVGQVAGGQLSFSRPAGSSGSLDVWWDGDNSTDTFNGSGLGGVDLTAGGRDAFRVTVASSSTISLRARLLAWSSGSDLSQLWFTLPAGGGSVVLRFGSFAIAGGGGADFSAIGALFLATVEADGGWSFALDELRTTISLPLFADGFESGDVSAWSATFP